jgi:hypothetical protein
MRFCFDTAVCFLDGLVVSILRKTKTLIELNVYTFELVTILKLKLIILLIISLKRRDMISYSNSLAKYLYLEKILEFIRLVCSLRSSNQM